jgi:hypothetical protein
MVTKAIQAVLMGFAVLAWVLVYAIAVPLSAQQVSAETQVDDLAQGQFVWVPEASPSGPVVVLVSLNKQQAFVYRNGIVIGYTLVSTGKKGHETPTGVFTILQKDKDHVSSIYKAKMPYTERLTWSGICLHAGSLPGYPSSHGCVHLPLEFSRLLFEINELGATVVIADEHSGPAEAAHPAMLLSPDLHQERAEGPLSDIVKFEWKPERSLEGPVSLLLSTADSKLYVYRGGVEIGFAQIGMLTADSTLPEGIHAVLEGRSERDSTFAPGQKMHRWMHVSTDSKSERLEEDESFLASSVHIPPVFVEKVYDLLMPGTTLVITNRAAAPETRSDSDFVVLATQPEEGSANQ